MLADEKELRVKAVSFALELARNKTQTAEDLVKEAKTIHEFLDQKEDIRK